MAAEQGREVFAVPGLAARSARRRHNDLIKQGAALVTEAATSSGVEPILERPIALSLREDDGDPLEGDPETSERERIINLLGPSRSRSTI